jgi:hypothetical protein
MGKKRNLLLLTYRSAKDLRQRKEIVFLDLKSFYQAWVDGFLESHLFSVTKSFIISYYALFAGPPYKRNTPLNRYRRVSNFVEKYLDVVMNLSSVYQLFISCL